jgi:hypothetical protein
MIADIPLPTSFSISRDGVISRLSRRLRPPLIGTALWIDTFEDHDWSLTGCWRCVIRLWDTLLLERGKLAELRSASLVPWFALILRQVAKSLPPAEVRHI